LADERKILGMTNRLNRQIDIKLWPIEMIRGRQLNVQYFPDCDIAKPWELRKWEEKLFIFQQNPKTLLRDIGYLNRRIAYAKRCVCHFRATELSEVLRQFHAEKGLHAEQPQSSAPART